MLGETSNRKAKTVLQKRARQYFASAAIVVVAIYAFGRFAESIPTIGIAAIWAVTSGISAIAFAYPSIIKKFNTKNMVMDGSQASWYINGRMFRMIGCFILSALLIAGLMMESQKWTLPEWVVVVAAIPFYYLVSNSVSKKFVDEEFKPLYRQRTALLMSWVIVGIAITFAFLFITVSDTIGSSMSAGEVFSSTQLLFENSPSPLMVEVGNINYLLDGSTTFFLIETSRHTYAVFLVLNVIICASSAFALAHLLGLCSLEISELARVFQPIEEIGNRKVHIRSLCGSVLTLAVMVVLLFAGFNVADSKVADVRQTDSYSLVQTYVRDFFDFTAYRAGESLYDEDTVANAFAHIVNENPEFSNKRDAAAQSISDAYDTCMGNVDEYLESYYAGPIKRGLWTVQDVLNSVINPNAEKHLTGKDVLFKGVDFGRYSSCAEAYNEVKDSIRVQLMMDLSNSQLTGIPDWLAKEVKPLEESPMLKHVSSSIDIDDPQGDYGDRDAYKKALNQAIKDSRAETLAMVQ